MGRPENYLKYQDSFEMKFSEHWLEKLSTLFLIEKQVSGIHLTGKKMKIDTVITPTDMSNWKNKNIAFGIEFKSPTKIDRLHNQPNFMRQFVDYSHTNFENYGFIPILSCPRFELDSTYSDKKSLKALSHFLHSFQVGELDETYRGLSIIFQSIILYGKMEK